VPKIVSVDVETTGLIAGYHEVWEIGIVPVDSGREHLYYQFQPTDLEHAEARALQIGGFYERFDWIADPRFARDMLVEGIVKDEEEGTESPSGHKAITGAAEACWRIAKELEGATIMGLNPHFDGDHLEAMLHKYGHAPTWGHRYLDLGSYAAGAWRSKNVLSGKAVADRMEAHGIVNDAIHNAYADARWNVDAYQAIRDGIGG
jgi:DNA polymerase III epsilon subunit-like protein